MGRLLRYHGVGAYAKQLIIKKGLATTSVGGLRSLGMSYAHYCMDVPHLVSWGWCAKFKAVMAWVHRAEQSCLSITMPTACRISA